MTEPFDLFAELDAEIAKVSAKSKLKSDAESLRKKANNMRLDTEVRRRAAVEYREIQAIVEADLWEVVKTAALFAEQSCDGCGSKHFNFLQYMQQERKVRKHSDIRWVRIACPLGLRAKETIIQPLTTHICADCCEDHGFDAQRPTIRLMPHEGALTVSRSYIQEDINAPESSDAA